MVVPAGSAIQRKSFGRFQEQEVELFTLANERGMVLKLTSYGAAVTELHAPDRNGELADVVLGYDELDSYLAGTVYFGAIVGRVANRIRDGKFTLAGTSYALATNNPPHHLHGGTHGWDKLNWQAEAIESARGPSVRFTLRSPAGQEGYPGNAIAHTTYTLTHDNELEVDMEARCDEATPLAMAQHNYWNLGGHASGSILDHELELCADAFTPGDPIVPTGVISPVTATPFDFTTAKAIGRDLNAVGNSPVGYDHNFVVRGEPNAQRPIARVRHRRSGRVLTLEANQPGVQFYSGNYLSGKERGKGGVAYEQYSGLCLETQAFPNAINVPAWREQVLLAPGNVYRHRMVLRFTTE